MSDQTRTRVVLKYELRAWSVFVDIPKGAELLHVGVQGQTAYVWALIDPEQPTVSWPIFAQPTGAPLPPAFPSASYVGTFTIDEGDGELVFHVFDGSAGGS